MYNFEQARETNDLSWLVYGFDGWGEVEVPITANNTWEDIINEYAELTKNNRTVEYLEMCADESDIETRIKHGSVLVYQLETRPLMKKEVKAEYIKELAKWGFYYNKNKDHEKEIERLYKHIESVKTKLKLLKDDKKKLEATSTKTDLLDLKVQIQNIIKRDIDLRKISVKEWVYTLNNLPKAA